MADGADAARRYFAARAKTVLTFLGYSGSGYEDEAVMIAQAVLVLNEVDPRTTLVNIGGTPDGIGAVYPLAQRLGFETLRELRHMRRGIDVLPGRRESIAGLISLGEG